MKSWKMVWNKSEFFLEATYPTTKNAAFNVKTFIYDFYQKYKKGTGYVFGNVGEKK